MSQLLLYFLSSPLSHPLACQPVIFPLLSPPSPQPIPLSTLILRIFFLLSTPPVRKTPPPPSFCLSSPLPNSYLTSHNPLLLSPHTSPPPLPSPNLSPTPMYVVVRGGVVYIDRRKHGGEANIDG